MSRFEKSMLWITAGATTLTGIGLLWTKYFVSGDDPWAVINHPLQPWMLKSHIVVSPLLIFALGLISARHVWNHYRTRVRWGRKSGLLTAAVTVPMVLSGYLIQVITHIGWLRAIVVVHIVAGFIFALVAVAHQFAIRGHDRVSNGRSGMESTAAETAVAAGSFSWR